MNIAFWADVAQIIAALAVVASLIFVALELNQNNRLEKIRQRSDRVGGLQAYKVLSVDPVFAEILNRGRASYSALQPHEKLAFSHYMEIAIPAIMSLKLFSDMSAVGAANAVNFSDRNMRALIDHPGVREWWVENRTSIAVGRPGREEIDGLIGANGEKPLVSSNDDR